ncbi:MAG: DUF1462 family protein [Coriobacteriia bacterium]
MEITSIIGEELAKRYGDKVAIQYLDVREERVKTAYRNAIEEIDRRGLLYPVTLVDGKPIYDGAVSYPGIMSAVRKLLVESEKAD